MSLYAKGVLVNGPALSAWLERIRSNTGVPRMTWTLNNAWPTKIFGNLGAVMHYSAKNALTKSFTRPGASTSGK